ncbi:protein of unknown function UPF0118 [Candidatus Koribacter versatilis Ellin345]|uniref:Permease n=1 Tax=Koribacter versatilis (strain Ellin345) TaxID=204669 RepID=Q1IJC4_KORVE|nr:AI-2E family transporter [Candidatus Koribacter versatilis]ABF43026.1 protein of unknown function UPF0118 [Candidatus Koribacter versatilis Ellin345]
MHTKRTTLIFLAVVLVVALAIAWPIVFPFIKPVAFAIVIAVVFNPLYQRLLKRTKRPGTASFLTIIVFITLLAIPASFLVVTATRQAMDVGHRVSETTTAHGGVAPTIERVSAKPLATLGRYLRIPPSELKQRIEDKLNVWAGRMMSQSGALLANLFSLLANSFIALITVFFLFRDGERVIEGMDRVLPITKEQLQRILNGISNSIVANVYGMAAVGAAQGFLTALGLAFCSVSSSILLGLVAAMCSLIPIVGTGLVWVPAAGYLMITGHVGKGIFLLAWGAFVVSSIDNVIRPMVIQGRVQAHPLLILFALLGGVQAFGLIGLFAGPILLSVITVLLQIMLEEIREKDAKALSAQVPAT